MDKFAGQGIEYQNEQSGDFSFIENKISKIAGGGKKKEMNDGVEMGDFGYRRCRRPEEDESGEGVANSEIEVAVAGEMSEHVSR